MNLNKKTKRQQKPKYNIFNNLADQILEPLVPNTVEIDQITHHNTGLCDTKSLKRVVIPSNQ